MIARASVVHGSVICGWYSSQNSESAPSRPESVRAGMIEYQRPYQGCAVGYTFVEIVLSEDSTDHVLVGVLIYEHCRVASRIIDA